MDCPPDGLPPIDGATVTVDLPDAECRWTRLHRLRRYRRTAPSALLNQLEEPGNQLDEYRFRLAPSAAQSHPMNA